MSIIDTVNGIVRTALAPVLPTLRLPDEVRRNARARRVPSLPLTEYQTKAEGYSDLLVYQIKVDPTTIQTHDKAYTRTWRYRGRDLTSASVEVRNAVCDRFNRLFRDYQDGWMLHFDLDRRPTTYFPKSEWPDVASWLVDEEQRVDFERGNHYVSDTYITLTYLPPTASKARRNALIYTKSDADMSLDSAANLGWKIFDEGCRRFEQQFAVDFDLEPLGLREEVVPGFGALTFDDQLSFLSLCATGKRHPHLAVDPERLVDISHYIASETLYNEKTLRIGNVLFRPLTVLDFPEYHLPGILDVLDQTPGQMRANWRWISRDPDLAIKDIKKERGRNIQKRKGAFDTMVSSPNALQDPEAMRMQGDGEEAYGQARSKLTHFGWFTFTVVFSEPIALGEEEEAARLRLDEIVDRVAGSLQTRGFQTSQELGNELEAFLGTLPAHGYQNVVKSMLSARNLANFVPTTTVWEGERACPDKNYPKDAPPLAVFATNGNTPHYFNLHVPRKGGHTLVIGDTGYGKSTLVGYLLNKHRRYINLPCGAQQIVIDRDYSHETQCRAVGGTHIVVGPSSDFGFAPFADLDDPDEFDFALMFATMCLDLQGVDPKTKTDKTFMALCALRDGDPAHRTMSGLCLAPFVDDDMRTAWKQYAQGGVAGTLFDGTVPISRSINNTFTVFEVSPLIEESKLHRPGMVALMHEIERMCSQRIPTLLASEEFWALLDDPIAASYFKKWLKTMRKKAVACVLITQSLEDVDKSPIASTILGSCATKLILPNKLAKSTDNAKRYRDLSLEDWEIDSLVDLDGEHVFYLVQPSGRRFLQCALPTIARATVGVSDANEVAQARLFQKQFGPDWYPEWIFRYAGDAWRAHAYYGPKAVADTNAIPAPAHAELHPSDPFFEPAAPSLRLVPQEQRHAS